MRKQTRERGSALIIAIVLVIVVAGLSAAFLTLAVSHNKMTMGATHRENAFMVAESGIDEMIQKINTWSAGTVTTLTGNIGQNGTYTAAISPSFSGAVGTYTITSTGVLYGDASKSNITEKRGITTVIAPSVLYPYSKALFGDVSVDGSGTIFTDSYISSGGSYASQATNYDATHGEYYAGTKGSLGSNGDIDITGASTIYGNATPGPGGTVTTSGGVYITGSTAAATDPEPLPAPTYEPPIAQDDDEYKVTGGTHTIGTAGSTTVVRYGEWKQSGSSTTVEIYGDVTIYCDNDFSISGGSIVLKDVGGVSAKLTIIHGSGKMTLAGQGIVNESTSPAQLNITSSTTGAISYSGGSNFYGTVYAPNSEFSPSGGAELFGSFVADKIKITGGATFHWDEDLMNVTIPGRYRVLSCSEFVPS